MTDKNHEQYLEQIEIAVMETTKELMSKHNGDLRAMAKVCAEKQVEINRLKEYYNDDKKTIRNLRIQLAEATEEIEDINNRWVEDKEADRIEIEGLKEEIECRNSTWETKEKEYEGEIEELKEELEAATAREDSMFQTLNKKRNEESEWAQKKIVELKEEIDLYKEELDIAHHEYDKIKAEIQRSTISEARSARDKALADNSTLKEDIKNLLQKIEGLKGEIDGAWSDYNTEQEMRSLAEKELEELQNEHQGICSKYHADFCELEEKREEVMKLKEKLKSV